MSYKVCMYDLWLLVDLDQLNGNIKFALCFRFVSILLNVPVNNFSVMSERSHRVLGITSTFRR